jgi:protoporphyrinogen oxidase
LSTAYHLGPDTPVFEAAQRAGGECVTDAVGGYAFDRSGHLLHLRTPEVKALIQKLLPNAFQPVARDARIHIGSAEVRYPFQANTFGLPPAVKAKCLWDYLAAVTTPGRKPPKNFSQWARQSFGREISRLFFEPYNQKLWTVPPSDLTLEWMGPYVPKPDLPTVFRGAFGDQPGGGGYNASFNYPKQGGIEVLPQALAAQLTQLHLNAPAVKLNLRQRRVRIQGQGEVTWKHLISSVPLPALAAMLDQAPKKVTEAAQKLNSNSVLVINLGVARAKIHPAHWLYFPEKEYTFYRVGFPSNFGQVAPEGCSSLYAEVALPAGTGWGQRKAYARKVCADLVRAGILQAGDTVQVEHMQYLPYAYVIFDADYTRARQEILTYLEKHGVQCIGRWGHWEYSAMEDAILAGMKVAEAVK